MIQDTRSKCSCGKYITIHDEVYDGKCRDCRGKKDKYEKHEYVIRISEWDVTCLKDRPNRSLFSNDIWDVVITDVVKQIIDEGRKRGIK